MVRKTTKNEKTVQCLSCNRHYSPGRWALGRTCRCKAAGALGKRPAGLKVLS